MVLKKVKNMVKKEWKKAKANPIETAAKALAMAKYVASLVNVEHKFKDVTYANSTISSTPTMTFISGTSQGDGQYGSRNGDSVKLSSVSLRGLVTLNGGTAAKQVRVILINDLSSNGVVPNYYEVLDNSVFSNVYARYNPDFAGSRFKILYDKRFLLDATMQSKTFNFYRKLVHHLKYKGSGDTVANASTGHLFVMVVSDDSPDGTNDPRVEFNTCIRYIDN